MNQEDLAAKQSEAEANQRILARKRRGASSTRLTDPIADLTQQKVSDASTQRTRVSVLGGGEYVSPSRD